MSAAHKVYGTVELLEQILIHLDFFDLARCYRVSTHFQAVIRGSSPLKALTWLDVPATSVVKYHDFLKGVSIDDYSIKLSEKDIAQQKHDARRAAAMAFIEESLHPVFSSLFEQVHSIDFHDWHDNTIGIQSTANVTEILQAANDEELPAEWEDIRLVRPNYASARTMYAFYGCLLCQEESCEHCYVSTWPTRAYHLRLGKVLTSTLNYARMLRRDDHHICESCSETTIMLAWRCEIPKQVNTNGEEQSGEDVDASST